MQSEWTFQSSSGSGTYTTKRNTDGSLSCNCRGWTMKRGDGPRECKHTREVEGIIATSKPTAATATAPTVKAVSKSPAHSGRSIPSPMLASAMTTEVTGAEFDRTYAGWLMEEKHDGHRIGVVVDGASVFAWSRPRADGVALARALPDTIIDAMRHLSNGVYDGELVAPGGKSWDVSVIGTRLVFIAFDILEVEGRDMTRLPYSTRRDMLLDQLMKLPKGQAAVSTTESVPAKWSTVEAIWQRGGEGAILKRPTSSYAAGKRSPEWVKVKEKKAETLTVIGFEAGKMGPYSKLMLRDKSGHETTVKTLGNVMLREITANPQSYIGRRVVISYQLKTPNGSYRHGIFDHFAGPGE